MHAWGASDFHCVNRFRKTFVEAALKRGVDGQYALSCIVLPEEMKNSKANCVIDSYEQARKLFTPEYL